MPHLGCRIEFINIGGANAGADPGEERLRRARVLDLCCESCDGCYSERLTNFRLSDLGCIIADVGNQRVTF